MSADRILSQVLGSGLASGFAGGLVGGAASHALLSKKGRKLGKKALKVGGIAAVGGLAYAAWRRHREEQEAAAGRSAVAPTLAGFLPPPGNPAERESLGATLLQAMIAAAQADGHLDEAEIRAIEERAAQLEISEADWRALATQLRRPVDMNELVAAARTPEIALEIYTAALLAIEADTAAERGFLTMLAGRLGLDEALVEATHRELAAQAGQPSLRAVA